MASDLKTSPESSTITVVADILRDAQQLITQQLAMFRSEVHQDLRRTQDVIYPLACGLATMMVGAILLSFTLVHLLYWAIPSLTLWGAYGVVGGVLTATGVGMYFAGKKRLESFNPLPDKSAQALKENVEWLTQPK